MTAGLHEIHVIVKFGVTVHSFSEQYLNSLSFTPATTWLISQCSEARGRQALWSQNNTQTLEKLKTSAMVQSTESSNRIEGVFTEHERILPLIAGNIAPRDRSEEEIVGYQRALAWIYSEYDNINLCEETILKLHAMLQENSTGDAGQYKSRDNEIIEIKMNGEREIRFNPSRAKDVPKACEQLILGYKDAMGKSEIPDLICIATFIFDFLCIHPFRDGNGRVSRLLTALLLCQNGYLIGQFISLERMIEDSKEDYYKVLKSASKDWHEGEHDLQPWWIYFLSTLKNTYQLFDKRVG